MKKLIIFILALSLPLLSACGRRSGVVSSVSAGSEGTKGAVSENKPDMLPDEDSSERKKISEFLKFNFLTEYHEEDGEDAEQLVLQAFFACFKRGLSFTQPDFSIAIPAAEVEKEIKDYFGLDFDPGEKLSDFWIWYENGKYCVMPSGYYVTYHTVDKISELGDGIYNDLYSVECDSTGYPDDGEEEKFRTEFVIRKNSGSRYGYSLVSQTVKEQTE